MKLIIWCLLENQLVLFVHTEGGDAGGVMEGEVPFLAYFSYCAHYLVLPDKFTCSSFSTLQLKTVLPMHKVKRKPWDEQSGVCVQSRLELKMTRGLCNSLENPAISCFHGCTSLGSRSGTEGKQFLVWMQFYWSSCSGWVPHRTIWWFAGVTAAT